jgi:hypothetical protein
MKTTPFNEHKFTDITDKLEFYETEGTPPEVNKWADFQRRVSMLERRKSLDDKDILNSLINLFRRIDPERLTDEEAMQYADIADQYGALSYT